MANTQQPGAKAQMNVNGTNRKQGEWVQENLVCSANVCDCSGTCWRSYCCSPCLLQRNYNRYKRIADIDQDADLEPTCGLGWCCFFQCCLTGWGHYVLTTVVRGKIREYRRIEGSVCGDLCATACCLPCSLIQEAHEMESGLKEKEQSRNQPHY